MQTYYLNSVNYVAAFGSAMPTRAWTDVSRGYRYGFNGMEKDDEVKGEGNSYDFGARIYDSRLGRWLALDPLTAKNPNISPYVFVKNNTLIYVDSDGNDNVIYLVYLPSKDNKITVEDANKIAAQANDNFKSLGLKTTVVLVDMSKKENQSFNPNDSKYIDKTDGISVLGEKDEVVNYVKKHDKEFGNELEKGWIGGQDAPEFSENNGSGNNDGKYIAIDANALEGTGKEHFNNTDKIKTGGLLINHGAGHTAGINHAYEPRGGKSPIMFDGKGLKALLNNPDSKYPTYDDLVTNKDGRNQDYVDKMKERYGNNPACNSYKPK